MLACLDNLPAVEYLKHVTLSLTVHSLLLCVSPLSVSFFDSSHRFLSIICIPEVLQFTVRLLEGELLEHIQSILNNTHLQVSGKQEPYCLMQITDYRAANLDAANGPYWWLLLVRQLVCQALLVSLARCCMFIRRYCRLGTGFY